MIRYRLSQIAGVVNGELSGTDETVTGAASVRRAKAGDISFVFSAKYRAEAQKSEATAFVVTEGVKIEGRSVIKVKNGQLAQAAVLKLFHPDVDFPASISAKATVSESAKIGENVSLMDFCYIDDGAVIGRGVRIYPFCYVGKDAEVGEGATLYPHVVVLDRVVIGRNVILWPGAVIGADGFGYAHDGRQFVKIPQVGNVLLGDDVEIGANTTIDRATLDSTVIGPGTKIDNQVMVAHNVEIGSQTVIVSQVGIAGSARIGNGVIFGGQAGVGDHAVVEDGAMVAGRAGIAGHVKKGAKVAGMPSMDYFRWLRIQKTIEELPELKKKIDSLMARQDGEEQKS